MGIVHLHVKDVQNAEYSLLRFFSDEATNVLTVFLEMLAQEVIQRLVSEALKETVCSRCFF